MLTKQDCSCRRFSLSTSKSHGNEHGSWLRAAIRVDKYGKQGDCDNANPEHWFGAFSARQDVGEMFGPVMTSRRRAAFLGQKLPFESCDFKELPCYSLPKHSDTLSILNVPSPPLTVPSGKMLPDWTCN